MSDQEEQLVRRISERYWASDESVNGIAEELGMSKGRLYGLIRPLALDGSCPTCGGGPPVHPNRTARDRGEAHCPHCDWTGPVGELRPEDPTPDASRPGPSVVEIDEHPAAEGFSQGVLGGVLVGLAAGIVLGRWLRQ